MTKKLNIEGIEHVDETHATLLNASARVAARHENVESATLHLSPREKTGWLEYGLLLRYATGGKLYIGCIQRTPDSQPEFHS